jgi:hypothetical protein
MFVVSMVNLSSKSIFAFLKKCISLKPLFTFNTAAQPPLHRLQVPVRDQGFLLGLPKATAFICVYNEAFGYTLRI